MSEAAFTIGAAEVTLVRAEIRMASSVGVNRRAMHRVAIAEGKTRPSRNGQRDGESEAWSEIEGACAELAASKYLGRYWPADWWNPGRTVDIPPDIEVRWTKHFENGHLLVYDDDDPNRKFILVVGNMPTYYLLGWLYGREAMQEKFRGIVKEGRPPMLMVPRQKLRPIDDLKVSDACPD